MVVTLCFVKRAAEVRGADFLKKTLHEILSYLKNRHTFTGKKVVAHGLIKEAVKN